MSCWFFSLIFWSRILIMCYKIVLCYFLSKEPCLKHNILLILLQHVCISYPPCVLCLLWLDIHNTCTILFLSMQRPLTQICRSVSNVHAWTYLRGLFVDGRWYENGVANSYVSGCGLHVHGPEGGPVALCFLTRSYVPAAPWRNPVPVYLWRSMSYLERRV